MIDLPWILQLLAEWHGVPLAASVIFTVGGAMYVAMSRAPAPATASARSAGRRPDWLARRRALAGIRHCHDRMGVGYRSASGSVHLTDRELAHHGVIFRCAVQRQNNRAEPIGGGIVGRLPAVIVDPKGSAPLAETVKAHAGVVWTLDGKTSADRLDPRPWQAADLLLEAETYSPEARVFRDAAHQRVQLAA